MRDTAPFAAPIAEQIWDAKYRLRDGNGVPLDRTLDETFLRVARAAAQAEPVADRAVWTERFHAAMGDFGFIPAGRILSGAGTDRAVTLFNCFVMGRIEDDLGAIFDGVKEAALTMQQGGGIGHDFSTLRPKGAPVRSIGADASGPVSFMDVWDAMCRTIMSAGSRRGAMMATLRCDHPDIEAFIAAKSDPARLRMFNLSVLVTDAFVSAVRNDAAWPLMFGGSVFRTLSARGLWDALMQATFTYAEPGVIFIDRINARNNLAYCETIATTNPCGEQPLPPYGACLLGSVNLAGLVVQPFTPEAGIDLAALEARVAIAVRLLDNVIDISGYPLPAQREEALAKRRLGIGVTGLADALIFCGKRYGQPDAAALAGTWMAAIQRAAYRASAALAAEKGPFPRYDRDHFLSAPNVAALDPETRAAIARHGIRNGCLTSIAPTGTISLLAGNVSSGIEPVFDFAYTRKILERDGTPREESVEDYAWMTYRATHAANPPSGGPFVAVGDLSPADHLAMQAALQPHVDSSISKTINCAADISFDDFKTIYLKAYDMGLKGCTTYRPNPVTGSILTTAPAADPRPRDPAQRIVYMAKPLERDGVLAGFTYKVKWPASDHALYVTINDIERDGRRRPFEVFINTRNLEHQAWTVALTRMISAVFRRGGDVSFVADELKVIFDPQGGVWIDGRYVPSLLAAIGDVIEGHMIRIGFIKSHDAADLRDERQLTGAASQWAASGSAGPEFQPLAMRPRLCPRCASPSYVRQESCWSCRSCGYSTCT